MSSRSVLLLVTTGHPDIAERYAHANLGRLVQPRHYSSIRATAEAGIPWAADNDCYQSLDEDAFLRMLDAITGLPGCLFVATPDVVAKADETLERFYAWDITIRTRGLPVALVLQDGMTTKSVPWRDVDAVFVGGTTAYKLGADAAGIVAEAKRRRLWAHMGRVNTAQRIRYAASIGCDSCDGTKYARWKRAHLTEGIRDAYHASETQTRLVP